MNANAACQIVCNDAAVAWGSSGPLAFVYWKSGMTVESIDAFAAYVAQLGPIHPRGLGVISCVSMRFKLPSAEVRQRMSHHSKHQAPEVRASTTLLFADGFLASSIRSIVSVMAAAGGKHAPFHVARTLDDALDYLSNHVIFDRGAQRAGAVAFLQAAGAPTSI